MGKTNVLFVCLGNICRSPLAEGLLLDKIRKHGLTELIDVDSAGTSNYHIGERPDHRMLRTARAHNIDLPSRARQFLPEDFQKFDVIVAMDSQNLADILSQAPLSHGAELIKMGHFIDPGSEPDIPDPWFGGDQGFNDVFEMLDTATGILLQHLLHNYVQK